MPRPMRRDGEHNDHAAPKKPKRAGLFGWLFGGGERRTEMPGQAQDAGRRKVREIYKKTEPKLRDKLFYGGVDSAERILCQMSQKVFGAVTAEHIVLCDEIYLQTWIRSRGGFDPRFSTPSYIKEALCRRSPQMPAQTVCQCVDCALEEIYRQEPELKKRADMLETMAMFQQYTAGKAVHNEAYEKQHRGGPDYGLRPERPVFVRGFGFDKAYLSHLHTPEGVKLDFQRMGSMQVADIHGPVDIYRMLLPDGREYAVIYLCNYGTQMPEEAPGNLRYIP